MPPTMFRLLILIFATIISATALSGKEIVVADSASRRALPGASVFKNSGIAIGLTNRRGQLPYIAPDDFPVTLRYLGYRERTVPWPVEADTIFLAEMPFELTEVTVETRQHKVLHILAYVREYSNMNTYTDTVFLFREKMVDFMLPTEPKGKFSGWRTPRILKSASYYRYSNADGLDSVSSKCNNHFSWSDWVGIPPTPVLPRALRGTESATDTLHGKYSPSEIWIRNGGRVTAEIDALADTTRFRWVPHLKGFLCNGTDFENIRVRYNYDNLANDSIYPTDLTGYSFNVESRGRGREMFMFNGKYEPCFINTFAEVYLIDKEYITVKEARKWQDRKYSTDSIEIIEAAQAPPLQPQIQQLVARVDAIDHVSIRTGLAPDRRLIGRPARKQNFGQRALSLLKNLTGISSYRSNRNNKKAWEKMRREQQLRNAANHPE